MCANLVWPPRTVYSSKTTVNLCAIWQTSALSRTHSKTGITMASNHFSQSNDSDVREEYRKWATETTSLLPCCAYSQLAQSSGAVCHLTSATAAQDACT